MVLVPRELPQYYYSDLPENEPHIRLLRLRPGKREDYISAELFPISLKDAYRKYECISYVWGDEREQRRIIVDGHWVSITLNLFLALQHFRDENEEKVLWADAICIHQHNPPEKGKQVNLMGQIYASGSRTLVWLGLDHEGVGEETLEFIRHTSWIIGALVERYGSVTKIPPLSRYDNPISRNKAKWKLFEQFLQNVWFTRVWVMQEVGIAADVMMHWGDADIRFSDVITVNDFMRHVPALFEYLPFSWLLHNAMNGIFLTYGNNDTWRDQVVEDIRRQDKALVPHPNLIDSLIQASQRDVTDLRDYIYALLGHPLAKVDGQNPIVTADYTRNVDDVFLEVSAKLLKHTDPTLGLAVPAIMGKRGPRDLSENGPPSWVTRWELRQCMNNIGRPGQWFHAGGKNATPYIDIDIEAKTLTTKGIIFDTVKIVNRGMTPEEISLDAIAAGGPSGMVRLWKALPQEPSQYGEPDSDARWDAFTLTLATGVRHVNPRAEDDIPLHKKIAKAYWDYVTSTNDTRPLGTEADATLRLDAREYENDIRWTAPNRPFMITEKGFYGMGPGLVKLGDVCAVLPGFNVVYVLRKMMRGKNMYKLVGAAMVQGVMAGELVDEKDPLKLHCGGPEEIVIM